MTTGISHNASIARDATGRADPAQTLHSVGVIESLRRPPIAFAHQGGRADAPANTLEAFARALEGGATGLETDAWLTADGQVVLDHDGRLRRGLRRRRLRDLRRAELPPTIPTIDELYERAGTAFELSVDLKDPATLGPLLDAAANAGTGARERLWLCHPDWEWLASRRPDCPGAHLVHSTSMRAMRRGPERLAAQLSAAGIEVVNLHRTEWSGGLTTLFHRFGLLSFGWDAQHEREIRELVTMGIDGVYGDHVERLRAVIGGPGGAGSDAPGPPATGDPGR